MADEVIVKKEENAPGQEILNVRELSVGAGTDLFKVNREGVFVGAASFSSAPLRIPFTGVLTATGAIISGTITATGGTISGDVTVSGSLVVGDSGSYHLKLNGSNGRLELKSGSTVQSGIYNDASAKLTLDTNDSIVFRRHSGTLPGTGYITYNYNAGRACMDIEVANQCRIESSAGRQIRFESSQIEFNGDIAPTSDNTYKCGTSGLRWSEGNYENLVVDDLFCNVSFQGCGTISGCAYTEMNLLGEKFDEYKEDISLSKEERDERKVSEKNYTGFEEGDVLVWTVKGLKKADLDACNCVTAVADKRGMPIVLGAEKIKVIGKVAVNQFLVSSGVPGYARAWNQTMCGNPPIGTVIAQAMENKLDETEPGMIMAMIRKF